jgi:hypothetical protein
MDLGIHPELRCFQYRIECLAEDSLTISTPPPQPTKECLLILEEPPFIKCTSKFCEQSLE